MSSPDILSWGVPCQAIQWPTQVQQRGGTLDGGVAEDLQIILFWKHSSTERQKLGGPVPCVFQRLEYAAWTANAAGITWSLIQELMGLKAKWADQDRD